MNLHTYTEHKLKQKMILKGKNPTIDGLIDFYTIQKKRPNEDKSDTIEQSQNSDIKIINVMNVTHESKH